MTLRGRGSARRKASTCTGQHDTQIRGHTSVPRVGFEPTIPVFKRPKTILNEISQLIFLLVSSVCLLFVTLPTISVSFLVYLTTLLQISRPILRRIGKMGVNDESGVIMKIAVVVYS
jgi:hypothetical protein